MEREPPQYELLNPEKTKEMLKLFDGERTGWVLAGPQKWFFPYRYIEQREGFYNFKARPDDTWVLSFPRSGTTWTQELVWLLSNNLDFETASQQLLAIRFPFLEFSLCNHPELTREFLEMNKGDKEKEEFIRWIAKPGYEVVEKMPSPRFIKSHFPFSLLPGLLDTGCKVIYVARHPKDVIVSWYYLNKSVKSQGYKGDFATFVDLILDGLTLWNPYWEHIKEAWAHKNHQNLLFIYYEELQHDFISASKRVAKFLGKSYTDEQLNKVATYLDFKNFRNNQMVNASELKNCGIIAADSFIRKGQTGGSKNMYTPELDAKVNKWIEDNLAGTSIVFPYFNNNSNSN